MHLGNARTALLAWLQARAAGGRVALRIDDLDVDRCRPEHAAAAVEDLAWLGLDWDGEVLVQSARGAAYDAAIEALDARGLVYECFCTRAELRALATAPHDASDLGTPYPGTCRELSERRARGPPGRRSRRCAARCGCRRSRCASRTCCTASRSSTWRPAATSRCGARTGCTPTRWRPWSTTRRAAITDVLRGDDLLAPTGRQVLLQRLLGAPTPTYCHVPLLYGADGARLAKRHGAVAVRDLRAAGVPAAAVDGLARRDGRPRRARRAAGAGGAGRPLRRRGACTAPPRRSTPQTSRSSTAPRGDERVDLDG